MAFFDDRFEEAIELFRGAIRDQPRRGGFGVGTVVHPGLWQGAVLQTHLHPLLGRDNYQPLAKGMQAALPQLDLFAPAHNLQSLQALEPVLTGL